MFKIVCAQLGIILIHRLLAISFMKGIQDCLSMTTLFAYREYYFAMTQYLILRISLNTRTVLGFYQMNKITENMFMSNNRLVYWYKHHYTKSICPELTSMSIVSEPLNVKASRSGVSVTL